jgi:8-oxo-dGTP diphosphatase
MTILPRYKQLVQLSHQRQLTTAEIAELDRLSRESQQPNPLTPTLASVYAKIAIFNTDNQVLVMWRSPQSSMPGRADFPGGGIDFGEHPSHAAKREAKEEAGLDLEQIELVDIANLVHQNRFQLMFGYVGHITDQPVTLSWEHHRFAWLDAAEALALPDLPAHHKQLLQKWQTNAVSATTKPL